MIRKSLPYYIIPVNELVYSRKVQGWCALPYPNHPKGCPNYGKHPNCPPNCQYVTQVFNMRACMYLVHSEFDLASHVENMRKRHPSWTERQLRNVLYWQKKSKNQMKERMFHAIKLTGCNTYHAFPEALGVHMYATCLKAGLKLERIKDITICKHIALIGWR
jgi:predicted metal-binding protein